MANQTNEPPVRLARTRAGAWACWFVLLIFGLVVSAGNAADSYSTVVSNHLALETETRINGASHSEKPHLEELKRAVLTKAETLPRVPRIAPPAPDRHGAEIMAVVLPLAALLALGAAGYLARRRLDALASARVLTEQRTAALLAEVPGVTAFFRELRDGLSSHFEATSDAAAKEVPPSGKAEFPPADPLEKFLASAPAQIASLRRIFSEISRASNEAASQSILVEFHQQVSSLKESSRMPVLRPVWLVASALEGLLNQLSKDPADLTASVLRTAAGAVDLMEVLAVRGVNPDLAIDPPVRLLAVDDDPISRLAISFALKKAFNTPDLAPDGKSALDLVARQTYDVVFLDVDMPGMDGFEVCTEIHRTKGHETTPVVFVTRHSDFHSRAKSTLSGGEDLIAKPFLAFEITVKALTLALRGRLNRKVKPEASAISAIAATASDLAAITPSLTALPAEKQAAELNGKDRHAQPAASGDAPVNGRASWELSDRGFQALFQPPEDDSPEAFFRNAPAHLEELRNRLQAGEHAADPSELQKSLGQLYVGVHSLSSEAERAEQRAISKLTSALEGMLKKLLEHTNLITPSTLNAAAAALELLEELCGQPIAAPDLAHPPVRILVVDDDPVARRGISSALQLVFGRPDDAESGEAALALAAEKTFDLIFLDVLMPGLDGFTTCSRIHKSALNRRTPVVFVTSHDDTEARSNAVVSGGCGFIPKPVLASQIKLTALTFILRARLNQSEPAPALEAAACSA